MLNKLLVRVNNIEEIEILNKKGISNFLFPLEGFSIGYNTFKLEELQNLNVNVYLLLNRLFDNNDVNNFKNIKEKLNFVSGIFFEDIAVYMILRDTNINLVWNSMHAVISSCSVNSWLSRVGSASLSNELTKEEIKYILDKASKPLVISVFGQNPVMYSRRNVITNYNLSKKINLPKKMIVEANIDSQFVAIENEYGTIFFNNKYFDYREFVKSLDDSKILFYYFDIADLSVLELENIIDGMNVLSDNRFLNKKTIYKLEARS